MNDNEKINHIQNCELYLARKEAKRLADKQLVNDYAVGLFIAGLCVFGLVKICQIIAGAL